MKISKKKKKKPSISKKKEELELESEKKECNKFSELSNASTESKGKDIVLDENDENTKDIKDGCDMDAKGIIREG
jgi:hypothetical protein